MTKEDLISALDCIRLFADKMDTPNALGRVEVPLGYPNAFGTIQQLLQGTVWKNRFCWTVRGQLSVDVKPRPEKIRCCRCKGTGWIEDAPADVIRAKDLDLIDDPCLV